MSVLDRATEAAGRWLAARTSRRSFIGWTGRAAVVAAGGGALAGVFARQAEARVCGQSGVSPKCPTYDCYPPDFWGWCWYASPGCCANGGLKKICDCCRTGWPNVQGYCPAGASVYCIVESCLADPRVASVVVERFNAPTAAQVSLQRSQTRPAGSTPVVVLGDATDPRAAAVAAPVAAVLDAPLLLVDAAAPLDPVVAELQRLGAKRVAVVGPNLVGAVPGRIASAVDRLDVLHDPLDIASASVAVANWVLGNGGSRRVWCIGAGGVATDSAPAAAALAMADRAPVVVGADAANAVRSGGPGAGVAVVWCGPEPRARADAGGDTVGGDTAGDVVAELAKRAIAQAGTGRTALAVAPARSAGVAAALISPGGAVLLHEDGVVTPAVRDWCISVRTSFARAEVATGVGGGLLDQGVYDLQSALNGYDAHVLTGQPGEGLPVYAQPNEERVVGMARVTGPLPTTTTSTTLVGRANPLRQGAAGGAAGVGAAAGAANGPTTTTRAPGTRVPVAAPVRKPGTTTTTKPKKK